MSGKTPVRVAIAGLGRAGWGMQCAELAAREDRFRIVAACDLLKERRNMMAARFPGCRLYRTVEELLADADTELVSVATRSDDHVRHALLALEAGRMVFLEKPIAISYAEALLLKRAAAKAPGKLFVRHNRRFEAAFQHVREIISSGILGDVFEIKLRRNSYCRRDDWQTILRCGGGQLLNWGPHIIDHALQFLESPVKDQWSDLKLVAARGDAEDHLKIILRGSNGRIVDLEISGGAAISEPEYLVSGSKGALSCDGRQIRLRHLDPAVKLAPRKAKSGTPRDGFGTPEDLPWVEQTLPVKPAVACDLTCIWDHLYAAIREGTPFPITMDHALEVMRVVSLAAKDTRFERPARL